MSKKRKSGYYWVNYNNVWEVANYDSFLDDWYLTGTEETYEETNFIAIGKIIIRPTEEKIQ